MYNVEVVAEVTYACEITDEEMELVKEYAEQEGIEPEKALMELYVNGEIDLYRDSVESDFSTQEVVCIDTD